MPVHFGGVPCDMEEINSIAKKKKIKIIEDAAHAIGAKYQSGEKVGSCKYSDLTVFSFHPVKIVAGGEGGIVTTNSKKLYLKLLEYRSHGINKDEKEPFINKKEGYSKGKKNLWYYEMKELGFHYRQTDIHSALILSQMKKISKFLNYRYELARRYDAFFKKHKNAKETETIGANTISSTPDDMVAPSSMIIKLRSALSPRLLAFANYRSSAYKKLKVTGENAGGLGTVRTLHDPESGTDITVGVGVKVNDQINILLGTARGQSKDTGGLASALAPFKGTNTNFIGGSFKVSDNLELNASYSLTTFGDATAGVPPANAAPFTDNKGTRVTIGTKISF